MKKWFTGKPVDERSLYRCQEVFLRGVPDAANRSIADLVHLSVAEVEDLLSPTPSGDDEANEPVRLHLDQLSQQLNQIATSKEHLSCQ